LLLGIVVFIVSVQRVGANIHKDALHTLVGAPLSFFTSTDTGVVTNLFSQDLNLVDTELPNALLNFLFSVSLSMYPYLPVRYSRHFNVLTLPCVVILSYWASSCDAHIVSLYGYQLSIPGRFTVPCTKILLENRQTIEAARSRS
jgi:ABC-type multidrug transport system fused ATPase/permease subunit